MNYLDAMRICVAVADQRNFSWAAKQLRMSPTDVSRAVSAMETQLGITLFQRAARPVRMTVQGKAFLKICRGVLRNQEERPKPPSDHSEPRGSLVIVAPVVFGRQYLVPVVSALMQAHPKLNVQLTLSDRVVRLVEEGVDIAVREGNIADIALQAVRIADVRRVLVGSPAYLAARGTPRKLVDLCNHDLIDVATGGEWRFGNEGHRAISFEPRLSTNSEEAAEAAAIAGSGLARLHSYQAEAAVQSGKLVIVLANIEPPPTVIELVYQAAATFAPNVHAFVVAARTQFATNPSLLSPILFSAIDRTSEVKISAPSVPTLCDRLLTQAGRAAATSAGAGGA